MEDALAVTTNLIGGTSSSTSSSSNSKTSSSIPAGLFASSTAPTKLQPPPPVPFPPFTDLIRMVSQPEHPSDLGPSSSIEPISLALSTNHTSSPIFGPAGQERRQYAPPQQPALSATALLQKAAQMGATATNASLLRGLGIVSSPSPSVQHHDSLQWNPANADLENRAIPTGGLGLGLIPDGRSGLKELIMGNPSMLGPKQHTTLDFLGLGMAAGGNPNSGLSALITSIGGGNIDMTAAATASFGGGGLEFSGKEMGGGDS